MANHRQHVTRKGGSRRQDRVRRRGNSITCGSSSLVAAALLVGTVACGGAVDERPASADDEPVSLESTPWLLTAVIPPTGTGPLHAQRFEDGKLERVLLDASATARPSWSPSGRWLAYRTSPTAGGATSLWMRQLDADVWREARLVRPADGGGFIGETAWSPTSDQLLFEDRRVGGGFNVATPRADGSVAVVRLSELSRTDDGSEAAWSPTGDRIAIKVGGAGGARVFIHDAGADIVDGQPIASRELVAPSGTTLYRVEPRLSSGRAVAISSDGRWISAIVKGPGKNSEESKSVVAFSMSGEAAPQEMSYCPAHGLTSTEWCLPWSWHPEGATLLVQRLRRGEGEIALEAWSPDTGAHSSIGNVRAATWIAPKSTRLLTARRKAGTPLSIVDVRDVSAPVIAEVPTSELPSFQRATPSPDGRWLVVAHRDLRSETSWLEVVDLRGPPPWEHREIVRSDKTLFINELTWSPSSTFVIVGEDTRLSHRKRGIRIEVATGATSSIEYVLGPVPSNHHWSWEQRLGPDDRTVVIGRDGTLALLPAGGQVSGAATLGDTPEWASFSWRPSNVP